MATQVSKTYNQEFPPLARKVDEKVEIDFNVKKSTLRVTKKLFIPGEGLVDEPEWFTEDGNCCLDLEQLSARTHAFAKACTTGWGMGAIREWEIDTYEIW